MMGNVNPDLPAETLLATPHGEGRLVLHPSPDPSAVLLLSHGAGNGIETADLQALAQTLPQQGVSVALFEQPWRRAGRRLATAPPTLDAAFVVAAKHLRTALPDVPLVVGGRSAGARSACRTAVEIGASAVVALAFPLHPPGKPEKSRLGELLSAGVPTLVLQGEKDPFGRPDEFPEDVDLCPVPAADHSFTVAQRAAVSAEEAIAVLVEAAAEWLLREGVGADSRDLPA